MFVDDEPNVLAGLRNLLRKQRDRWEMLFAPSGKAALEEMATCPADVIVSDMRMPGMDGAELLRLVKEKYPRTVRIVLSGHAEREAVARAISVAHQFLSKPSDADSVRAVIERTCEFQTLMNNESIQRVVGSIERLPALPDTYWDLTRTIERPDSSLTDVAAIVERDPAMSVKVLQLTNSAYFGLPQKTDSIAKAVAYLGLDNLKGLVLAAHVFNAEGADKLVGFNLDELREESVLTANLARRIAKEPKNKDTAFTAGLVHDIGKLVLARAPACHYHEALKKRKATGRRLAEIERESFGTTHGTAGAYLLGVWGIPLVVAEVVAFHDEPALVDHTDVGTLAAVHLAAALAEAAMSGGEPELDGLFLERAGLLPDLAKWREFAMSTVKKPGLRTSAR